MLVAPWSIAKVTGEPSGPPEAVTPVAIRRVPAVEPDTRATPATLTSIVPSGWRSPTPPVSSASLRPSTSRVSARSETSTPSSAAVAMARLVAASSVATVFTSATEPCSVRRCVVISAETLAA